MFRRCLITLVGFLGFSAGAVAVEFGSGRHDVYTGDINGDDVADVYFHATDQLILLHGDITTPIVIPAGESVQSQSAVTIDINGVNLGNGSTVSSYYSTYLLFQTPAEPLIPPYSEQEIVDFDLGVSQENTGHFYGDFDGDGHTDVLVTVAGFGSPVFGLVGQVGRYYDINNGQTSTTYVPDRFILVTGGPNSRTAAKAIGGLLGNEHNIFEYADRYTVRDADGDGRDELVYVGGEYYADVIHSFDIEEITYNFSTPALVLNSEYHVEDTVPNIPSATLNGASTGSFRVDESGAATYAVPLSLPAGTAGVAPEVALSYSSQAGNGLLGWGWNMSGLSVVSRCKKSLLLDGQAAPMRWDGDVFCYNGQRLLQTAQSGNTTTYATATDSLLEITAFGSATNPDYFQIRARDGSLTTFGSTDNSRQGGVGDSIHAWSIEEFSDSVGNKISYEYLQEGGNNFRLNRIDYAYGGGSSAHARVEFNYESRLDVQRAYVGGREYMTDVRLENVVVYNDEPSNPDAVGLQEVRTYNLYYYRSSPLELFAQSRVHALQECVGGECLPAVTFDWAKDEIVSKFDTPLLTHDFASRDNKVGNSTPLDVNGDGYLDMAWIEYREHNGDEFYQIRYTMFDPETGQLGPKQADWVDWTSGQGCDIGHKPSRINWCENWTKSWEGMSLQAVDYNGDGRQDLAIFRDKMDRWQIHLSKPNADGTWQLSGEIVEQLDFDSAHAIFMDADSDGLVDLVSPTQIHYLRGAGQSEASSTPYSYGIETDNIQWEWEVTRTPLEHDGNDILQLVPLQAGDFNGDGAADLLIADRVIRKFDDYAGMELLAGLTDNYYVALAEGEGSFRVVNNLGGDTRDGSMHSSARNAPALDIFASDINGDGYTDILRRTASSKSVLEFELLMNTGDGFATPQLINGLRYWDYVSSRDHDVSLQDVNGDGYADLLVTNSSNTSARYRPWDTANQTFGEPKQIHSASALSGSDARSMFYDATGDGRLDLIFFSRDRFGVAANLGEGPINVVTEITNGLGATTRINYEPMHNSDHYRGVQYVATDENGVFDEDEFYRQMNAPFSDVEDNEKLDLSRAPILEALSSRQLVTAVEGDAPAASSTTPGQIDANNTVRLEYYYYQARLQAGGSGSLGFKALLTEDPQNDVFTTSFYRQDWPFVGMPRRTETRTGLGDLMSLSESEWGLIGWQNDWPQIVVNSDVGVSILDPVKPYLKEIEQTTYKFKTADDPAQIEPVFSKDRVVIQCKPGAICNTGEGEIAVSQKSTTTNVHDEFGNLIEITTLTEGGGLTINSVVENTFPTDSYITLHGASKSYAELGRVSFTRSESTRTGGTTQIRESGFEYYESGAFAGMLRQEIVEPNNLDTRITTTYSYDTLGNKTRADTVARNHQYNVAGVEVSSADQTRSQTFEMDDTGRYVDTTYSVIDGQSFTKEIVVARNAFGAPTHMRSAVSDTEITIEYDVLGREIYRADNVDSENNDGLGAWSRVEYLTCQSGMRCPTATSYVVRKTDASGGLSLSFFDILGRETRTAAQMFDGRLAYVDTEFHQKGHVLRRSEPYFVGETQYWSSSELDILGRPVLTTLPDGSEQHQSYNGYSTTFTNALGVSRTERKNGLGELVAVNEALGARLAYTYDGNGNLQFIRAYAASGDPDQGTLTTEVRYDSQNRKIWMDDPDKGIWEYKYNAFGELVWQRDAKGQVVLQSYDTLGRMTSRRDYHSNGSLEGETTWYYDGYTDTSPTEQVVSNALMQVSAIVMRDSAGTTCDANNAIQCVYPSYDNFGRPVASQVRNGINGTLQSYITETSYDAIGRVATQTDALNAVVISGRSSDSRYLDNSIQSGTENHYNAYGFLESVSDLQTEATLYTLLQANARGQATEILRGNGVTSRNEYDPATGRITEQTGDIADVFKVQHITYAWDVLGNLSHRLNDSTGVNGTGQRNLQESFCYDDLNRVIKTNIGTTSTSGCSSLSADDQDLRYDSRGNITYKHDVGSYTYDRSIAGPHAVTSTSAGDSYLYDDNGNMTDSFGVVSEGGMRRHMTYSTYDKVTEITKGDQANPDHTTRFKYGVGRGRYWREDINAEGVTTTTQYLGSVEKITKSNEPNRIYWKRYLGKTAIITVTTDDSNTMVSGTDAYKARYVYNDHLGSLDVITDEVGTVVQGMSFDPWGQRRHEDTWQPIDVSAVSIVNALTENTTRGYTGHEMLDDVGIIHMNGRIYDARIARFMQADPFIQAATSTQSYNRYAYVWNNPLNSTDPSGYIKRHVYQKAFRIAAAIAITVAAFAACGPACAEGAYAVAMSVAVGAWAGAVGAAINGASGSGILKGAVTGGLTGGMGAYVKAAKWKWYYKTATMAVTGGATSVIQGGKFGHGFVAAAVAPAGGAVGGSTGSHIAGALTAAVVGGAVSEATGGKFESGAATAAFSYVANSVGDRSSSKSGAVRRYKKDPLLGNLDIDLEVDVKLFEVDVREPNQLSGADVLTARERVRQGIVDELLQDANAVEGWSKDVSEVLETLSPRYVDTYEYSGSETPGDFTIGNGQPGAEERFINWDNNGNLNKESLVDTFFHEVQHRLYGPYSDHNTSAELKTFQMEVDKLKSQFYEHWGDKWK